MSLIAAATKIAVSLGIQKNQEQILRAISMAAEEDAGVLLTPEGVRKQMILESIIISFKSIWKN